MRQPERPARPASGAAPDPDALRYAAWWEPVLAPASQRLLERIAGEPRTYLDIGAGTGGTVLAAGRRWPHARLIALDASAGMLSVGRQRVAREWPAEERERFAWLAADAASLPLEDASVEAATSAFMLQLVDDRAGVLGEARRVLRPGGTFGLVTWLADGFELPAADVFDDVVDELGLDEDAPEHDESHEFETVEEAADELRRAGFEVTGAGVEELRHRWDRDGFLAFKQRYDDRELFESLPPPDRARLLRVVSERLASEPDEAFELRAAVVWALSRRP